MKKSNLYLLITFVIAIMVIPLGYSFWKSGAFDLVNQTLGSIFWVGVIAFIAFIFGLIFVLKRWFLGSLKPKDIPNGLPATATVIKSFQGGMSMRYGGYQYYSLVIEVNVTNPQGETWPAKIEQLVPITQVGLFQPGISFAVKYDPNNKSKVVIDQSASRT
jgi:hypothetical protein